MDNEFEEMAEIEDIYGMTCVMENMQVFLSENDKLKEFVEDFKRVNDFDQVKEERRNGSGAHRSKLRYDFVRKWAFSRKRHEEHTHPNNRYDFCK